MSEFSDAAKAAAIMCFTSGTESFDQARDIFDLIENEPDPNKSISQTIAERHPRVVFWFPFDRMDDDDWWTDVTSLARSFDNATQHFAQKKGSV